MRAMYRFLKENRPHKFIIIVVMVVVTTAQPWVSVVWWLSLLHNFIQQSLNSGSAQVQILLAACRRFEMVRISDNGPGW